MCTSFMDHGIFALGMLRVQDGKSDNVPLFLVQGELHGD